jgi:hypothetical protein
MSLANPAVDNDDWRAAVAALKLVFPEYRESTKVDVTATAQASTLVLTKEMRLKLIERREKALAVASGSAEKRIGSPA